MGADPCSSQTLERFARARVRAGEPFYPPLGMHWLESLADYAIWQGHTIHPFRLNFKGQNIGLCARGCHGDVRR